MAGMTRLYWLYAEVLFGILVFVSMYIGSLTLVLINFVFTILMYFGLMKVKEKPKKENVYGLMQNQEVHDKQTVDKALSELLKEIDVILDTCPHEGGNCPDCHKEVLKAIDSRRTA